jgi:hypothetical protein
MFVPGAWLRVAVYPVGAKMLAAAIGSVACGTFTWIVVEADPAAIGVCHTATVAVLAASAAFANASDAKAAAATKRLFFICGCPFVNNDLASLCGG